MPTLYFQSHMLGNPTTADHDSRLFSFTQSARITPMAKKDVKLKRLVLLDVHAILHRAYHALPDFESSKGEPTGALYGLCTMLIKIIQELKPNYIAACFDLPGKTYRHEVYDAYKAGRAKTDDALVAQIIRSRDVFKAFNIPGYEKEGFEAGDRFIPFEIKEGILFKKVKMPNIKQEFEKLSRDIQRRFQSTGVSKDDAKEAVKWARKK